MIASGTPLPPFDFQCPLASLPLAFKTEVSTIPKFTSYLYARKINDAEQEVSKIILTNGYWWELVGIALQKTLELSGQLI